MKVKVLKRFADKETKEIHEAGSVINISQSRYKDVQRFVEEVKETKKASKKK